MKYKVRAEVTIVRHDILTSRPVNAEITIDGRFNPETVARKVKALLESPEATRLLDTI